MSRHHPERSSGTKDQRKLKTATLSSVNEGILRVALGTEMNQGIHRAADEPIVDEQEWEFFCECGRADCDERVSLTLPAYVTLHDESGAVLASGHRLSQVERARSLREDADALKRQAEHQVKRAKKRSAGEENVE